MELLWTTGGLHSATGSMQSWKVRDLAAVIMQLAIMEEKRTQQKWDLQRQGQEKRWMKNENKEIWRCYRMSDPAMRRYRKGIHNIWHERNKAPQTTKAGRPNLWHTEEQLALCDRKRRDRKTTSP